MHRINDDVIIRLKWDQTEYKGRLISVDSYMNIQLSNTEEFIEGKSTGSLGQVLIRYVGAQASRARTRELGNLLTCCLEQVQQRPLDLCCQGRRDERSC